MNDLMCYIYSAIPTVYLHNHIGVAFKSLTYLWVLDAFLIDSLVNVFSLYQLRVFGIAILYNQLLSSGGKINTYNFWSKTL